MYAPIVTFLFLALATLNNLYAITQTEIEFYNLLQTRKLEVFTNAIIHGNLIVNGIITSNGGTGGSGNGSVSPQSPVTVNAAARFANTSGTLIKNSPVLIDDAGNITINGITKGSDTVSWPSTMGAAGTFLGSDGAGNLIYTTPAGAGNVSTALPFVTNNSLVRVDTPSGATNIEDSNVTLDDSGNIAGINTLTANTVVANVTGNVTGNVAGNATSATTASLATNATNVIGPFAGDVTGIQTAMVVSLVGGQTNTDVASATVLANNATTANTPNTIIRRDPSGNFVAGTITANLTGNVTGNLSGNATTATSATTALNATNFTGSLAGDVTGPQTTTVVASVGGQTAANVASGAVLANAATNSNTANAIVRRDASGNFISGTITANLTGNVTGNLSGNATTATNATTAVNFTGSLSGDVTGNQSTTQVDTVGGQAAANIASATILANAATNSNAPGAIVRRDGSGNFTASTITANLTGDVTGNLFGNATTATSATTATTATNFSGTLAGDVSGNQGTTQVDMVGGQTAANIASATILANAATSNNAANTIVRRDALGNFTTNMITISGAPVSPTDAVTKNYVDSAVATGFTVKTPAVVVSTTNVVLSGLQTIDGVLLVNNDRVLLVGQTSMIQNGLWVAHVGAWTRPTDFATGTTAGTAYVLITSGTTQAGSSWVCSTPTAIIDTDPISFDQFSIPGQTTAANVGAGAGQFFRDKTGITINLKTLSTSDPHIIITNNTNDVAVTTDATSANTAGTIVARDGTGTFAGSLTGAASLNVLKAGDTMTGNLNLATQSELRLEDAAGGEYVGLNAPSVVSGSYTINLPASAPISGQVLQALSPSATQWGTVGGSPTANKTYYVALNGSDTNDGSFNAPFLTVSHAVTIANSVASAINPIVISIGAGIFIENNSGGSIVISSPGISIIGSSNSGTTIVPTTAANDLFSITTPSVEFDNLTILLSGIGSTGNAISLTPSTSGISRFNNMTVLGAFQTSFSLNASAFSSVTFNNILCAGGSTGISVNNFQCVIKNSLFQGSLAALQQNMGISITGSNTQLFMLSNLFRFFDTGITITGSANARILGTTIESATNGIIGSGATNTEVVGCNFIFNTPSTINVNVSGANTTLNVIGCSFDGRDSSNVPQGTALQVTTGAFTIIDACTLNNLIVGIHCGAPGDTISTFVQADATTINNCTTHVLQEGSSRLAFTSGIFKPGQISISDSTNVSFAAFDDDGRIAIGTTADEQTTLYEIMNGNFINDPSLVYEPNYYGNQGTVYKTNTADPAFNGTQAPSNNAYYYVITGDRTRETGINLISDTANIGTSDNVRGWAITKTGTSADLSFNYSNNDTSGQAARGSNAVINLNGFDNQVEFPLAANAPLPTNTVAKLIWAGDTNLYRSAANVLITDGNLIVGGLTANRALTTNASKQLTSSVTTDTELGFLSGTTSSVQTQINSKVSKAGDTMTGTLTIPAGTTAAPSLQFTGSTNTGLSAPTVNNLSFSTNGTERMDISSTGVVAINNLTPAGVVHNDASGNLSTSLIVNTDVSPTAGIVDTKLATISTAGKVSNSATTATSSNTANTIVLRDPSGDFSASTITSTTNFVGNLIGNVTGTATSATTAINFTGPLLGDVTGTQGATVVSFVGGQTAADVANATTLANAATNLNTPATIVKRDGSGSFAAGTITLAAGSSSTPSLQFTGSTNTGLSALVANTLSLDTNGNQRLKISPTGVVSINGLTSTGVVHNDALGNLSTSLIVNADVDPAAAIAYSKLNLSNSIVNADINAAAGIVDTKLATISTAGKVSNSATTATSANTASAIVARDGSGNFSAGTITASLTGAASLNVLKAGDTMTGTLTHPAGTTAAPSIQFTGSTNTGLSAATANNLSLSTNGAERMKISPTGVVSINGLTSTGVVHNDASGNLSTSLIVNADVDPAAAIVDTKLATISTSGKVANSATTATSATIASTIVSRDASGNFSANTIAALVGFSGNLNGNVTGSASLNVLKAGDTMTGTLILPAGTAAVPSLQFTGSTNTGLSTPAANNLAFSTNGAERMDISSAGVVAIMNLNSTGIVHNDASGNLTTSLIVNADVNAAAGIVDTKLATISTAGKVSNSATTATSANTASAIVARDASGNFSAGTITASLTGAASLNVLKAGDTMTGTLTHPAGTAAAPSIQFTGSTNTGLSAATANTLSLDTNGTERMSISTTKIIKTLATADQAIQSVVPATNGSVTTNPSTSILLLKHVAAVTNFTVNFPPSPVDGQLFSIVLGTTSSITLVNVGGTGGAAIVNGVTALNPATTPPTNTTANTSVTYLYSSTANTWYRFSRG